MTRVVLAFVLLLLGGCAQNAVFELTVMLPPNSGPMHWAHVQARSNDTMFDTDWAGTGDLGAFPLTTAVQTIQVSIVTSDGAAMLQPLSVKITFCSSALCSELVDSMAPQEDYKFDRVFYLGHRTSYALPPIAAVPASTAPFTTIPKCRVAGCRDGVTSDYCTDLDTRHFCE